MIVRIFAWLVGLLCIAGSIYLPAHAIGERRSQLVISPAVVDFGDIRQQEERAASFEVTNDSSSKIHIHSVRCTCACADISVEKPTLNPGEMSNVIVYLKTRSRRGSVNQGCHIFYKFAGDDRTHAEKLVLKAEILPDVRVSQLVIRFERDVSSKVNVKFSPGQMAEFDILEVVPSHDAFSATVIEEGNLRQVEIAFNPKSWRVGARNSAIRIRTNSARQPWIGLSILVE